MKFRDLEIGDVFEYVSASGRKFQKVKPQIIKQTGKKCSRCGGSSINAIDLKTKQKLKLPQNLSVRKVENE